MQAVFKMSGFQFTAEKGSVLQVPLQNAKPGSTIKIDEILLVKDKDKAIVGQPNVENAHIEAKIMESGKEDKVIVFKKKRRHKYRRIQGHRQDFTRIKITKIVAPEI